MAAAVQGGDGFRADRALRHVLGLFAVGVTLSAVYARTGQGIPCPFRTLTGWSCPLCGSTRLGAALLHAEIGEAFSANPLVFLGLFASAVLMTLWTVEVLGGPVCRVPGPVASVLRRVSAWRWLAAGAAVMVVDTLARNLV